jgi:hypothetical protein
MSWAFSERAASLKVGRDSGGPEGVAADLDLHAELGRAALDRAPGVDPVHGRSRERAGAAEAADAEEDFATMRPMPETAGVARSIRG